MCIPKIFSSLIIMTLGMTTMINPVSSSEVKSVMYSNTVSETYTTESPFYVEGWVSGGAVSNTDSPITTGADPEEMQLNQLYMILGLNADRRPYQAGIGGRVDLLYGTDYLYTSSLGLESSNTRPWPYEGPAETVYGAYPKWNRKENGDYKQYGLAMPQAYAEFYAPILAGLNVKVGHYYSPIGYESVMSPHNFFYTHSNTMLYGEAQTLTGVMATQKLNQNFSLIAGADQGWNTWDGYDDDVSILGGVSIQDNCKLSSLAFTLSTGKEIVNWNNPILNSETVKGRQTNYSLIYQRQLLPNIQYVLQNDIGVLQNGKISIDGNKSQYDTANWYSLVNYLFYQMSSNFTLGVRFEWFKDEGLSRFESIPVERINSSLNYTTTGNNYYNLSLGLNWKPCEWITVRPEVRYDWSDFELLYSDGTSKKTYDNGTEDDMVTVGGDMVIKF